MLKNRPLLRNTLLLTLVSLSLRALGLAFQSYITGAIGAAGVGLFSLAMSVSALGVTVATSGLRYAVTRLVAEQVALSGSMHINATMRRAFCYAAVCGGLAFAGLYLGAERIAAQWVGDDRVTNAIRILAFGLPLIAFSGAIGGCFTAIGKVGRGSVPQIAEQLIMFGAVAFLLPRTLGDLEAACSAIVFSSVIANGVNLIISLFLFAKECKTFKRPRSAANAYSAERSYAGSTTNRATVQGKNLTKRLLLLGGPIALSAYARTGLSTLQHLLVPAGLKKSGLGATAALAAHGVIHGMVFPVLMFPSVLMVSAAELLIPELTAAQVSGNMIKVRNIVTRILKLAFYFSFGCSMTLFLFGGVIGKLLYGSADAGNYIRLLAPLVLVMYMDMITDGLLKGLGEQLYTMFVNISDSLASVVIVWLTLPIWGINAYLFMIIITEILNFAASMHRLRKVLYGSQPKRIDVKKRSPSPAPAR